MTISNSFVTLATGDLLLHKTSKLTRNRFMKIENTIVIYVEKVCNIKASYITRNQSINQGLLSMIQNLSKMIWPMIRERSNGYG